MDMANQALDDLITDWSILLNSHQNGDLHTAFFKELFKKTWGFLKENTFWGYDDEICIDIFCIPLILKVFEFSKRRELPENEPRRVFGAATTFCESLVESISKCDFEYRLDPGGNKIDRKAIDTGYIELGISWNMSRVIHINQFEEEFEWLCQYYGEEYGY